MKIKTIIVDDEKTCREMLRVSLQTNSPEVDIVAEASGVDDAVALINTHKPGLLFLDIEINGGTGFDVLSKTMNPNMQVIFVTGFNHFAIKAFKFSAIDYLLKPVDPLELLKAVNKVLHNERNNELLEKIELMQYNHNNERKKIALPVQEGIMRIMIGDILRCESDNSYTTFFFRNKKKVVVSRNLKEYDELLGSYGFFRVHQSHLINMEAVEGFIKEDGGVVVMEDGAKIPVARRRKDKLLEELMR